MKTNITAIGIIVCSIAACNLSNSNKKEKFDPHQLDGLWMNRDRINLACRNGGVENCGRIMTYSYASINYPNIRLCKRKYGYYSRVTEDDSILSTSADSQLVKEDVKVAYTSDNNYKIKVVNGNNVEENNIAFKIKKDTSTIYKRSYIIITKMKNGGKVYSNGFNRTTQNDLYEQCIKGARDTTDVPADTLRLDLDY